MKHPASFVVVLAGLMAAGAGVSRAEEESSSAPSGSPAHAAPEPSPASEEPVLSAPPAVEAEGWRAWRFDEQPPYLAPRGFDGDAGAWFVHPWAGAPSGRQVLTQGLASDGASRLLARDFEARDLELEVRFLIHEGETNQAGGLLFRAEAHGAFLLRVNPKDPPAPHGNLCLYFLSAGPPAQRLLLAEVDLNLTDPPPVIAPGRWHRLRVRARAEMIEGGLDERWLLSYRDGGPIRAGRVGLWTNATAVTSFDDLRARVIEE